MASIFGGGFDATRTPLMNRGDEDSVEESKVPDPDLVDTGDIGRNNPHGNAGCSGVAQAIHKLSAVMLTPKTGMQKF